MDMSGCIKYAAFLGLVLVCMSGFSCNQRETLHTGDLIFVGNTQEQHLEEDSMGSAISAATGSGSINRIHTAIVEVDSTGRVWVIDATVKRGVDRHPLDTFLTDFRLKDGSYPVFEVKRLKDDALAEKYVRNAKRYLGLPYDEYFLPGNDAMYCSELVYESYRTEEGIHVFQDAPMNFKSPDGTFPIYWERLFERHGQDIPQGVPGTNPQKMSEEPSLRPVAVSLP